MPEFSYQPSWADLLLNILLMAISVGLFAAVIAMAARDWRRFAAHWRVGLALGLVLLLASLPGKTMALAYLDMGLVRRSTGLAGNQAWGASIMQMAVMAGLIASLVLGLGWNMLLYCTAAAQWERLRLIAMPNLSRRPGRSWRPILWAGFGGWVYGIASAFFLLAMNASDGEGVRMLMRLFPGLQDAPPALLMPAGLLMVLVAAVTEELQFRGCLHGFLLQAGRETPAMIVVSTLLVTLLWSVLHIPNSDSPGLKMLQIAVAGVLLCEVARRWCVEAAIAGHAGLNVGAMMLYWLWPVVTGRAMT